MSQSFFKMCIKNAIEDLNELKVNSLDFNVFLQDLKVLQDSDDYILPSKFDIIWKEYKDYLSQYSEARWIR